MSLEAPRCATLPCASCPLPFLEVRSAGGLRVSPRLRPLSCSLTMHGTGGCTAKLSPLHATRAAGAACCSGVSGHRGSRSVKQQAAGPSGWCQPFWGKLLALQKGPVSPFPWEKRALTHFLCTANTFTTLELPRCLMRSLVPSSSPLKSLLYLYAKITNTSSVMAIFTHRLYFTAVQKKCAI